MLMEYTSSEKLFSLDYQLSELHRLNATSMLTEQILLALIMSVEADTIAYQKANIK